MPNIMDEYIYCLYPEEVKTHVPIIEQLMLDGMKRFIPDVNIKVESSCMLHWDKKAAALADLEWTPDGRPILEEPEFIKALKSAQK